MYVCILYVLVSRKCLKYDVQISLGMKNDYEYIHKAWRLAFHF